MNIFPTSAVVWRVFTSVILALNLFGVVRDWRADDTSGMFFGLILTVLCMVLTFIAFFRPHVFTGEKD